MQVPESNLLCKCAKIFVVKPKSKSEPFPKKKDLGLTLKSHGPGSILTGKMKF